MIKNIDSNLENLSDEEEINTKKPDLTEIQDLLNVQKEYLDEENDQKRSNNKNKNKKKKK